MSAYLFTGPTLSPGDARQVVDAVCLPPVQQGDVYRVALRRPRAIGIIDGYFEGVPAVRHKEILWAMNQGIEVFGGASMGALRAAELAQFGMLGVGEIFSAYATRELEDDDEVAVVHGQRGTGYAAATEALVNIRATLAHAEAQGVIRAATRDRLIRLGKGIFYKNRDLDYRQLLATAGEQGLPGGELRDLADWLGGNRAQNRVNQKRDDALTLLQAMKATLAGDAHPKPVRFRFEHTTIWGEAMAPAVPVLSTPDRDMDWLILDDLLDELRLGSDSLLDAEGEARLRALASLADYRVDAHLADYLYNALDLGETIRRAYDKESRLLARGILRPHRDDTDLSRHELLEWYFGKRLGCTPPNDIHEYAAARRFADTDAFLNAVVGEYLYEIA